jgi:hypothetical protein
MASSTATTTHVLVLDSTLPALLARGEEKQSDWQFGDVSVHVYAKVEYDLRKKRYGDGERDPLLAADGLVHVTGYIDVSPAPTIASNPPRIGHGIKSTFVEVSVMGTFPARRKKGFCTKFRVDCVKQKERYDLEIRNVPCRIMYNGNDNDMPKHDGELLDVDETDCNSVVMSLMFGLWIPNGDDGDDGDDADDMAVRYDASSEECDVYSSENRVIRGRDPRLRDSMQFAFDEKIAKTNLFSRPHGIVLTNHDRTYFVFFDPSMNRPTLETYDGNAPLRVAMDAAAVMTDGNVLSLPPEFDIRSINAYLWGEWLIGADLPVQALTGSSVPALAAFLGKL